MFSKPFSYVLLAVALLGVELLYFYLAVRFGIVDRPNSRSSHVLPTIRGGGIIFVFAILIWFLGKQFPLPWFVVGAVLLAMVSFLDDLRSLRPSVRFLVQLLAVSLLFWQLWPISWPHYLLVLALVVSIGTLNAFNFMDGINGITGAYAMVMLLSFFYIQEKIISFTDVSLIITSSISVLIFLYFNFRKKARCFAGDVGSITIAFILILLLLQLILVSGNFLWVLLFIVYGIDSVITIVFRLRRRENIFKSHRTHLFQYLSNELAWPHLSVSSVYGIVQLIFNIILIFSFEHSNYVVPILSAIFLVLVYLVIRMIIVQHISKSAI